MCLLSGKSWDEIIPKAERQKLEEEELHQQLVALNPPPRSRKTVKSDVSTGAVFRIEFKMKRNAFRQPLPRSIR